MDFAPPKKRQMKKRFLDKTFDSVGEISDLQESRLLSRSRSSLGNCDVRGERLALPAIVKGDFDDVSVSPTMSI